MLTFMNSILPDKLLCLVMSSYNICSGSQQAKKKHLSLTLPKPFDFSQNSYVPFHRVTFEHPIS